jgi:hypothetical protein
MPWPLPSKSFPVNNSSIILSFDFNVDSVTK